MTPDFWVGDHFQTEVGPPLNHHPLFKWGSCLKSQKISKSPMKSPLNPVFSLEQLPEVFVSTGKLALLVSRELKKGHLRKLASRLYTKNLKDAPVAIVKRHLWPIVGAFFPDGLISDRTALENAPAADGSIFLISKKKRGVSLPGIAVHPRQGIGPIAGDNPFINGLHLCSTARAYLENMVLSRARKGVARTLSKKEIGQGLEKLLQHGGEGALKKLRNEMRAIAPTLDLEEEFQKIDALIGTLLGTKQAELVAETAIARARGVPYDATLLECFHLLHAALSGTAPVIRPETSDQRDILAFFDAYFSNFIEGTEFAVSVAKEIVFKGKIPRDRPQDAHDVLGTFRLVSDSVEMKKIPTTFDEFISLIQSRHSQILEQRPEKLPGQFKTVENRAGSTIFVSPDLVLGTLQKGFELYQNLKEPFHRAVYMMYLIAEVHPFLDGNGRLGRVMMNAELVAAEETRVIIPSIYRNNYLVALKALAQAGKASPLIRTLDFAQKYTHSINWSSFEHAQQMLEKTHAFLDPNEADLKGIRLILPTPEILS